MGPAWQRGPIAPGAIGHFLVPDPLPERLLFAEPLRRRMRVRFGGEWVADSEDVVLLHEPGQYPVAYFPLGAVAEGVADSSRPLALFESGFAPRWYVPRADVDALALTPAQGQTFCPYKGLCSYYDIGDVKGTVWSYEDAWPEVGKIRGMVSFEADKVEVYLDGTRMRLEPGQSVIAHGVDRNLSTDEAGPGRHP
jgi:uncharacterized protein (DUF427 family)